MHDKSKTRQLSVISVFKHKSGLTLVSGVREDDEISFVKREEYREKAEVAAELDRIKRANESRNLPTVFVSNVKLTQYARYIKLTDKFSNDFVVTKALSIHHNLSLEGLLFIREGTQAAISPEVVERQTNDRGHESFRVNWNEIRSAQTAMLLGLYVAYIEGPFQPHFLKEMYQIIGDQRAAPQSRAQRVFEAIERGRSS